MNASAKHAHLNVYVLITLVSKIVPELNSRLSGYSDYASINADHSAMCKFSDSDDPGYQSVVAAIRKMAAVESRSDDTVSNHPPSANPKPSYLA
jgi:hypothetical protein